jgi:hypothetical protein
MNVEPFNVYPGLRNVFEPLINNEDLADVVLLLKGRAKFSNIDPFRKKILCT